MIFKLKKNITCSFLVTIWGESNNVKKKIINQVLDHFLLNTHVILKPVF
jgi:hypothetical protein